MYRPILVKRLATLLLLVILVSVAGFVAPRPASACSCMQLDPTTGLSQYPAAFVGTLVEVEGQVGAVLSSDADTIYRFEVEDWVKGDLGEFVDIHSSANGASCGIEVGIGNRAGIFVSVRDGQYTSSLCETIDADVLLTGAEPLEVGAPGPGRLLVSGSIGGFSYVVLNGDGEIVAGVNGPEDADPFDQPWQFSTCPGGNVLVEQWSRWLIVRDLSDLSIIRQVDLGDYAETTSFSSTRCMSDDGSQILLAGEEWSGNNSANRVFTVSEGLEAGAELPLGQTHLGQGFVVIQDHENRAVSVVDTASQKATTVHTIARSGPDEYIDVSAIAIAPDDTKFAIAEVDYDGPGGANSTLLFFGADGTALGRTELRGETWWIYWVDTETIVVNTSGEDGNSATLMGIEDDAVEVKQELKGWQASSPVGIDGRLYATEGGAIVTADLVTGETEQLTVLPTQFVGPMAVLPADFEISPGLIGTGTESASPNTVPPLFAEAAPEERAQDVTGVARGILFVLVVAAVGWAGYLAVRHRRRPQTESLDQS